MRCFGVHIQQENGVPLLRRPIVSGCARGTARPNDLGICLELQSWLGSCIGGCSSAQGGGETDGLPQLVNALCEVGDEQCRDIICLVRRVGVRHGVGPSGVRDCLGMENRGRLSMCHGRGSVVSMIYWTPCDDVLCVGRASLVRWRCVCRGWLHIVGRLESPGSWGTGCIRVTMVQEWAQIVGKTMWMVGRVLVSLRSCFQ
jgi:hypothetical protein